MINGHKLIQIKQKFSSYSVEDLTERIKSKIANLKLKKRIKPGNSIAITAGSRGITEKKMGTPIKATMNVVKIGISNNGIPVYVDKNVINADKVVAINRVKPYTRFAGEIESGLIKMLLFGLGKDVGARA